MACPKRTLQFPQITLGGSLQLKSSKTVITLLLADVVSMMVLCMVAGGVIVAVVSLVAIACSLIKSTMPNSGTGAGNTLS